MSYYYFFEAYLIFSIKKNLILCAVTFLSQNFSIFGGIKAGSTFTIIHSIFSSFLFSLLPNNPLFYFLSQILSTSFLPLFFHTKHCESSKIDEYGWIFIIPLILFGGQTTLKGNSFGWLISNSFSYSSIISKADSYWGYVFQLYLFIFFFNFLVRSKDYQ